MGMSYVFGAFGALIGNPVAGLLVKKGWIGPAAFCGSCNAIGAIFIFASRVKKAGWKITTKV